VPQPELAVAACDVVWPARGAVVDFLNGLGFQISAFFGPDSIWWAFMFQLIIFSLLYEFIMVGLQIL